MNQIFDFLKKYLGSRKFQKQFRKIIELLVGFVSIFTFGIFIYQLGYLPNNYAENYIPFFFNCGLILLGIGILVRLLIAQQYPRNRKFYFDLGTGILFVIGAMINWEAFGNLSDEALIISKKYFLINILVILIFIQVLGKLSLQVNKLRLAPSLIFILSFLILILIGAALLSLPKATTQPITFIDAVFTSTSAVCVTGLIVLDTSKDFTEFGQIIIMTLFQIGGLGMMTFTTFFGFFFKGSLSVQNSLFLKDYITETNIGEISSTLIKIIVFTILVEFFAAVLIFYLSDPSLFRSFDDHAFFSAFHAISAFCNAGFSTLSGGLYEPGFRLMYSMHLVVAFT
ncbi:MAG: trk system potassium uptake protein TrkH, partial [Algoriphagus sp.]